jgi:hypothetical protein
MRKPLNNIHRKYKKGEDGKTPTFPPLREIATN